MARMMLLLAVLAAGCDDETTAYAIDLAVTRDLSMSQCTGATTEVVTCDRPSTEWCFPFTTPGDLICVCAHPADQYFCCEPDTWQCPIAPRTGDFCCPQPSGIRTCGGCGCIDGQFVCTGDMGNRD
jgi:hypothetical protein